MAPGRKKPQHAAILSSFAAGALLCLIIPAYGADLSVRNRLQTIVLHEQDGSWELQDTGSHRSILRSQVGAEIDQHWMRCSDYPRHQLQQSAFEDALGTGSQATMLCTGLAHQPSLTYSIQLYKDRPGGTVTAAVKNTTERSIAIQAIRPVDVPGERAIQLGDDEKSDRILSDSFSEDWPPLKIYSYQQAPGGVFRGVGSQLLYNREARVALFFGALTSQRFLSILRWRVTGKDPGYTVDSTGTTEIQASDPESGLVGAPARDLIPLSLPLAPGEQMESERLMFATGSDYLSMLENYGTAIRTLHHPRQTSTPLMGWWSWTAYYADITAGTAATNAQWLAQNLLPYGYDLFHLDLGYAYARGEYATPNRSQFPDGLLPTTREARHLGLRQGFWTAPFEVSDRSWVYEHHKDWLVHNAQGQPVNIGVGTEAGREVLYVLDATNPEAQQYLRATYKILTGQWGAQYIKLDFMDNTAIEGVYHRPHTTALEAQRIGLQIIRDTVGEHVLLDKDGSPMLNTVGLVDEGRLSQDTGHTFLRSKEAAPGIAARFYMDHNFFQSDPDAFTISKQLIEEREIEAPLTLDEAQASVTLAALAGGMFEIGDDLPALSSDPERLDLARNPALLEMIQLGRPAIAIDLLSYRDEDEQPSIFVLHEDQRQTMLAIFNWTDQERLHTVRLADLSLPEEHNYAVADVFHSGDSVAFRQGELKIENQPPHSVRLLKIADASTPPQAPAVIISAPTTALRGQTLHFTSTVNGNVPALQWTWDFGDGVQAHGPDAEHTYTQSGEFHVQLTATGVDGIPFHGQQTVSVKGNVKIPPAARLIQTDDSE
jgi:alpha-galactosidase